MRQNQMGLLMSRDGVPKSGKETAGAPTSDIMDQGGAAAVVGAGALEENGTPDMLPVESPTNSTQNVDCGESSQDEDAGNSRRNLQDMGVIPELAKTADAEGPAEATLDEETIASVAAEAVARASAIEDANPKIEKIAKFLPAQHRQQGPKNGNNPGVYPKPGATRQTRYGKKAQETNKKTTTLSKGKRAAEKEKGKDKEKEKEKKVSGLGRGKGFRAQSHKRGRQDFSDDEAVCCAKVEVANTDLDKLWTNCGRQLQPLRRVDQTKLSEMEQALLEGWGIDPRRARALAKHYKGSWLHPTMPRDKFAAAILNLIPPSKKEVKIPPLGRPYKDVWIEENFLEMLREEEADGAMQGDACLQRRASSAAAGETLCAGGTEPVTVTGERRSLRGGVGRRNSGLGAGGGGGGGYGSAAGGTGDGETGVGGGGRNVVLPCCKTVTRWQDLVPSHDEARFRESLAAARQRLNLPRGFGFCPEAEFYYSDEEEEEGEEREKASELEREHQAEETEPQVASAAPAAPNSPVKKVEEVEVAEVDSALRYRRQLRHRGPSAEHFKYRPDGCTPSNTHGVGGVDRSTDRADKNHAPIPFTADADTKESTTSSSDTTTTATSIDSSHATPPGIPSNKSMLPVWKGGESNSICHPLLPPRKKKVTVAATRKPSPPPLPIPAAARAAIKSPAGSLRSAAVAAGPGGEGGVAVEEAKGEDILDEDDDEVCRELRHAWEALKTADAMVLHKVVELEGLCRQERCLQHVWERASDTQSLLCSSLSLSQLGKGIERTEQPQVGLSDDFPYYDPTEMPVIVARRAQKDADQSLTWINEETIGWPPEEIERERATRQKAAETATKTAQDTESRWLPQRLAAGREGQKGRGRGVPIPGGVAHPFLLRRDEADFLYSIGLGDSVEVKDEWGAWCRGKVVAVRGEGGWCASTDTNVLRAVKVSFKGWGPAMDVWLPVDGGMLAKPGTHLPKKGSPTHCQRPRTGMTAEPADKLAHTTPVNSFATPTASRLCTRGDVNADAAAAHTNGFAPRMSPPAAISTTTPTVTTVAGAAGAGVVADAAVEPSALTIESPAPARTLDMVVVPLDHENVHFARDVSVAKDGGVKSMSVGGPDDASGDGRPHRASATKRRREESLQSSPAVALAAPPHHHVGMTTARDLNRPRDEGGQDLGNVAALPGGTVGRDTGGWMPAKGNRLHSDHNVVAEGGGARVVHVGSSRGGGVGKDGEGSHPNHETPSWSNNLQATNSNGHQGVGGFDSGSDTGGGGGRFRVVSVTEVTDSLDWESESSRTRPLRSPRPSAGHLTRGGQQQRVNSAANSNTFVLPTSPGRRDNSSTLSPNGGLVRPPVATCGGVVRSRGYKGGAVPRSRQVDMGGRDIVGPPVARDASGRDAASHSTQNSSVSTNSTSCSNSSSSSNNKKKRFVSPWANVGVVAWGSNKSDNGDSERRNTMTTSSCGKNAGLKKQPAAVKPTVPPAVAAFLPPSAASAVLAARSGGRGRPSKAASSRDKPSSSSGMAGARGAPSTIVSTRCEASPASLGIAENASPSPSAAAAVQTTSQPADVSSGVQVGNGGVGTDAAIANPSVNGTGEVGVGSNSGLGFTTAATAGGAGFGAVDGSKAPGAAALSSNSQEAGVLGGNTGTGSGFVNAVRTAADNGLKVVLRRG